MKECVVLRTADFSDVFNKCLAEFIQDSEHIICEEELISKAVESFEGIRIELQSSNGKDEELSKLFEEKATRLNQNSQKALKMTLLTKAIFSCNEESRLSHLLQLRASVNCPRDKHLSENNNNGPSLVDDRANTRRHREQSSQDCLSKRNELYSAASYKLGIRKSEIVGRFAIATEDIAAGETVIVEDAFVSTQKPESYGEFCHHCFKKTEIPIPCPTCPIIGFCTDECRGAAMQSYHKVECSVITMLSAHALAGDWLLALRTATFRMTSLLQEYSEQTAPSSGKFGIFCLESHRNEVPQKEKAVVAFGAVFLATCFLQIGCINENARVDAMYILRQSLVQRFPPEIDPVFAQRTIATALYHTLQALKFNTHSIMAQDGGEPIPGRTKVGLGLYPVSALLNHSCNPNVFKYFIGDRVYIVALRKIRQGEEIASSYGPRYTNDIYESRQQLLSTKFYFKCECEACLRCWPTKNDLPSKEIFKCSSCDCSLDQISTCHCGLATNESVRALLRQAVTIWMYARKFALEGRADKAVELMTKAIELLEGFQNPSTLKSNIEWDLVLFKSMEGN